MTLDPQLSKLPPQNIEAEQGVLGAVLIDSESLNLVIDVLQPDDFYREGHRAIFRAMLGLYEKREAIDIVTLTESLRGKESLESVGGASYIASLVSLVPTSANIKSHARIVREKSIFRKGIYAASEILREGFEEPVKVTAEEFLDRAGQAIFEIAQKKSGTALVPMQAIVGASFSIVEERYKNKGAITGISTGFADLDVETAGLQDTDLIIVAGRPSMGKTAFVVNVAESAAIGQGKKVAIFSLEMSKEQLVLRMLGSIARVDANKIRTGNLQERDWVPLSHAAGALADAPIYIDDTPAQSVMDIRARARRMKAEHGLDLVIVDYLQLMRGSGGENNREQEIAGISRGLKALAKDLRVPVVALSQLNRALESRSAQERKPRMADLRESGALEQDADVILFMYREEVYNNCICPPDMDCGCGRRGAAEVIIGKQRNGPTKTIYLRFLGKYTRFENATG